MTHELREELNEISEKGHKLQEERSRLDGEVQEVKEEEVQEVKDEEEEEVKDEKSHLDEELHSKNSLPTRFKQDSSDITPTDFDPSDYYDD